MKFIEILTVEAALKAVESDGYTLRYVPSELRTEAVALKAVGIKGCALRYVPAKLRTEAVALKAVGINGDALQYVLNSELLVKIAAHFKINVKN